MIQDIPYFYEICLKTADNGADAVRLFKDPYLVGQYYAAPYVFYPGGLCFALVITGVPCGYLVSVPDTASYNCWLEENWLPPLRQLYCLLDSGLYRSEQEKQLIEIINKRHFPCPALPAWRAAYPAHLHIDLLPGVQGRGWGRKLITQARAELSLLGVGGVHLGVSTQNSSAVAFYTKIGFTIVEEAPWGFVMGIATGA